MITSDPTLYLAKAQFYLTTRTLRVAKPGFKGLDFPSGLLSKYLTQTSFKQCVTISVS